MTQKKGIDVSEHQGSIDWVAVRKSGVEFALVRAGWTHYEGGLTLDDRYHENVRGAQGAGLPVGVYAYGYDLSIEAAEISSKALTEALKPYRFEYPIYYDQEYEPQIKALTRQQRTDICRVFLDNLQKNGYYAGLYASKDWLENWVFDKQLADYDRWVAQYASTCTYSQNYGIWQHGVLGEKGAFGRDYTIKGAVAGVSANCDLDLAYRDYPALIKKAGLNGWRDKSPDCFNAEGSGGYALLLSELRSLLQKYGGL